MQRGFSNIILIIVGFLLVLVLLGFFAISRQSGSSSGSGNTFSLNSLALERKTVLPCGITVIDPKPNTRIHLPLTIRGYTNGCGWNNAPFTLGYVKMLNDKGQTISATYPLSRKDANYNLPAYFEATIPSVLSNLQTTGVTLFFKATSGKNPAVFELPVSF
jgi:hypothetical protein